LNQNSLNAMSIKKILVTGANGQLGWELAQAASSFPQFEFVFVDRSKLDLSNPSNIDNIVSELNPDAIINTAAYTAVDKAEIEKDLAYTINAKAVEKFAEMAAQKNILFITYSTDYVFSGNAVEPYLVDSPIAPINYYGATKADGESLALYKNPKTIVIRTSWVFSSHGNNFVKTMLRLMKEREELNVVGDQVGRPTYAHDLAIVTLQIVEQINAGNPIQGIYHYANTGAITWYDFAVAIKKKANLSCTLRKITSEQFPTPAKRPTNSVLDTSKIEKELSIEIQPWEHALDQCLQKISEG
jgi:dTDP-4-dehydrorhamnose reductase